jgi:hypothetical protein
VGHRVEMIKRPLPVRGGLALIDNRLRVSQHPHFRPRPIRAGNHCHNPTDALVDPDQRNRYVATIDTPPATT